MDKIGELLKQSTKTIVFTGAGMSTESGLPDFRSKDSGLWEQFDPQALATIDALHNHKETFLEFYQYRLQALDNAHPHKGHNILFEWEKTGKIHGIITQNVDGFHHKAGNHLVQELHGSFRTFFCHTCHKAYESAQFLQGHTTCSCGGTIVRST